MQLHFFYKNTEFLIESIKPATLANFRIYYFLILYISIIYISTSLIARAERMYIPLFLPFKFEWNSDEKIHKNRRLYRHGFFEIDYFNFSDCNHSYRLDNSR